MAKTEKLKCTKCKKILPVTMFHRSKTKRGYKDWCKNCRWEAEKQRRTKAKEKGMCIQCKKNKAKTGKMLCESCLQKKAELNKKRFIERKAKNLCFLCGKREPELGKSRCKVCLESQHRYAANQKAKNICHECGQKTIDGKTHCEDCLKKSRKRWANLKTKGICVICKTRKARNGESRCDICSESRSSYSKRWHAKLKAEVIRYYGGKCACCGEDFIDFLSIDHIEGKGNEHRRKIKTTFYQWLKNKSFPDGFQVLCLNCNWGKHMNGGICPHQTISKEKKEAYSGPR